MPAWLWRLAWLQIIGSIKTEAPRTPFCSSGFDSRQFLSVGVKKRYKGISQSEEQGHQNKPNGVPEATSCERDTHTLISWTVDV